MSKNMKTALCMMVLVIHFLAGCASAPLPDESIHELNQTEWDQYYQLALAAYNDPLVWQSCGKTRPLDMKPHWRDEMKPWGEGPGVDVDVLSGERHVNRDMVTVHVPVSDIGEEGRGVPHVNIYFQHPSRMIMDIMATYIMF